VVRRILRAGEIVRMAVHSPGDVVLCFAIMRFIIGLPAALERCDVRAFVRELERAPRPRARDAMTSYRRVVRIRDACLALPGLWQRNTCYVRAFTLYRFLDPADHCAALHVGVESRRDADRLRGHAWITLDGELLEGPDAVRDGALTEWVLDGAI